MASCEPLNTPRFIVSSTSEEGVTRRNIAGVLVLLVTLVVASGSGLSGSLVRAPGMERPSIIEGAPGLAGMRVFDAPPAACFNMSSPAFLNVTYTIAGVRNLFQSCSSGNITWANWTFQADGTAQGNSTIHEFALSGNFSVMLTVSNATLNSSASQVIEVFPAIEPRAAFTFSPAHPAAGQTVSFDASSSRSRNPNGSITRYHWSFGDKTTGTGERVNKTYSTPGAYNVTLTVTDNYDTTGRTSQIVTVGPLPVACFTMSSPAHSNVDYTVTGVNEVFDGSCSGGNLVSWGWSFGDGATASGKVVQHAYATNQRYPVNLTVTDNVGLTNATSEVLFVYPAAPPIASFTLSRSIITPNGTVNFNGGGSLARNPGSIIKSYSWTFGDGSDLGPLASPLANHTYPEAGRFRVTLNVTDSYGYTNETSATIIVDAPPTAAFTTSHPEAKVGRPFGFNGGASFDPDGTITTWTWAFGDGAAGSGTVVSHVYAALGSYNATLTVVDNNGFNASVTKEILVVVPQTPAAQFSVSPSPVFLNVTVTFDGRSSSDPDGVIVSYAWRFDNGTTASGPVVSRRYATPGPHSVTLTVTDEDGKSSNLTTDFVVVTRPTASFTFSPSAAISHENVTFNATGSSDRSGPLTFRWSYGDGTNGSGPITTKSYGAPGHYNVTLTVTTIYGISANVTETVTVVEAPAGSGPPLSAAASLALWLAFLLGMLGTLAATGYVYFVWRRSQGRRRAPDDASSEELEDFDDLFP